MGFLVLMPYHTFTVASLFDSDQVSFRNKTVILGFVLSPLLCSYITTMIVKSVDGKSWDFVSAIYIVHFMLSWLIEHFPWNPSWWLIQAVSFLLMAGLTEFVFNKKQERNVYIQLDHSLHLDDMFDHEL